MSDITWKLTDIYESEEAFKADMAKAEELLNQYAGFKGKLNTEENILAMYKIDEELCKIYDKMFSFRYLKKDEKVDDAAANKAYQEIQSFGQKFGERLSFVNPEVLSNSDEFLKGMMDNEPELKRYKNDIEDSIKAKPHVLSAEVEEAVAYFSRQLSSFSRIFDKLTEGDFTYKDAIDSEGKAHKVTEEKASLYLESKDRKLRQTAYNSRIAEYKKYAHTITDLFLQMALCNCQSAKLRKYPSFFESCMEKTKSTPKVYDSLISAVHASLPINHKYFALRKKILGYDEMHHFDNYVQIIPDVEDKKYTYEEAKEIVLKAVAPLGEQYVQDLTMAFSSSWSDVYEKDKKANGAYSLGVYGVHPYVLQNFNGTYNDVSTTAHEFGHAMHSFYSAQSQPFPDHDYTIMVAEVASTVNETFLIEYMLKNESDKRKKAAYIMEQIKGINATLIRQTMFAEFERWVHEEIRKGNELTCEEICEYYFELVKSYFGDSICADEELKYEWARIPHFYRPFYVYKYATGISSALCIVENILEKGDEYTHKYIEMLHMGGSLPPLDELRHAEVDLETEEPVKKALEFYSKKIDELEKIYDEIQAEEKETVEK